MNLVKFPSFSIFFLTNFWLNQLDFEILVWNWTCFHQFRHNGSDFNDKIGSEIVIKSWLDHNLSWNSNLNWFNCVSLIFTHSPVSDCQFCTNSHWMFKLISFDHNLNSRGRELRQIFISFKYKLPFLSPFKWPRIDSYHLINGEKSFYIKRSSLSLTNEWIRQRRSCRLVVGKGGGGGEENCFQKIPSNKISKKNSNLKSAFHFSSPSSGSQPFGDGGDRRTMNKLIKFGWQTQGRVKC